MWRSGYRNGARRYTGIADGAQVVAAGGCDFYLALAHPRRRR